MWHAKLLIMLSKMMEMDILFSLRILVVVFFFRALGKSLVAKPVGPYEFPLTCFAATVFLACLKGNVWSCVV